MHVYLFFLVEFILAVHCENQILDNCSTLGWLNDNGRNISYTIQRNSCEIFDTRDKPSKPFMGSMFSWFVDNKSQKIGLNISWYPEHISSIKYLRGYLVKVWSLENLLASRYFCLNGNITKIDIYNFSYDCFGYKDSLRFYPGQKLFVEIQSLPKKPHRSNNFNFSINIPKCGKDSRLDKVYECIQLSAVNVTLNSISCTDRSATVGYLISSYFNNTISADFIKNGSYLITKWQNLSLNGSVIIKLNSSYNLHDNYTFSLLIKNETYKHSIAIEFKHCLTQTEIVFLCAVLSTLAILAVVFIIILVVARKTNLKLAHYFCKNCAVNSKNHINWFSLGHGESEKPNKVVTLYLVYVNDSDGHRDVVLSFAELLESFGFKVIFELYQRNDVYDDPVSWMDTSLSEADKVFVIWSPRAAERWQKYSRVDDVEQDYFTPVVKNIYNDLFLGNNILKYVFVYFDYCSQDVVPLEFIRNCSPFLFQLMKEFKNLYVKVKGLSTEAEKIINLDEEIHERGEKLSQNIKAMCDYVASNPFWFKEHENSEDINVENVVFPNSCQIFRNQMQIIPPSVEGSVLYPSSTCNVIKPKEPKKVVTINLPSNSCDSVAGDSETSGINTLEMSNSLTTGPSLHNTVDEASSINSLEISNRSTTSSLLNSQDGKCLKVDPDLIINPNRPDNLFRSKCSVIPPIDDSTSNSSAYLSMISDADLKASEIRNVSDSQYDGGPEKVSATNFCLSKTVTFNLGSCSELYEPDNSLFPGTASPVLNKKLNIDKSNVSLYNKDAPGDVEVHAPVAPVHQVNKKLCLPEVGSEKCVQSFELCDRSLPAAVLSKNSHQPQVLNSCNLASRVNTNQLSPKTAVKTITASVKDFHPNDKSLFVAVPNENHCQTKAFISCNLISEPNDGLLPVTSTHVPSKKILAANKKEEKVFTETNLRNDSIVCPVSETVNNDFIQNKLNSVISLAPLDLEGDPRSMLRSINGSFNVPYQDNEILPPVTLACIDEVVDSMATLRSINAGFQPIKTSANFPPVGNLEKAVNPVPTTNNGTFNKQDNDSGKPSITLAPIRLDCDPMETLISINKSCSMQQQQV